MLLILFTIDTRAPKKSNKRSYFGKKVRLILSWELKTTINHNEQANVSESEDDYEGPLNLLTARKTFKSKSYKTVKKNKNLKQILTMERDQQLALDIPTCKSFMSLIQA